MEQQLKCKTADCPEFVTVELRQGAGVFSITDLAKNIEVDHDKLQISADLLSGNPKRSQKLSLSSEGEKILTLNLRKGYTAEASLKCPRGHEHYYTIEVR